MTVSLRPSSVATDADSQRQALSAPVNDPLWLLARQWQTGAFIASDGGTPVEVSLAYTHARIDHARTPVWGPLEPVVEAERLPTIDGLDTRTRMLFAAELVRRLRDAHLTKAQVDAVRAGFAQAYPLRPAEPTASLAALAGRLPDPSGLHGALAVLAADGTGDPFPNLPGIGGLDPGTASKVEEAVRGWYAWTTPQVTAPDTEPAGTAPATWNRAHLEYQFDLTATDVGDDGETSLTAGGFFQLHATGYHGAGLDWFAFDRGPYSSMTAPPEQPAVTVRPIRVTYPGMPRPRFWELEDGDVNLDALRADDRPAHAVLATFAHQYSNDWFLVPLEVPSGVCRVTTFTVTDTFHTKTAVAAVARLDAGVAPWHLWDVTRTDEPEFDSLAGGRPDPIPETRVFLPSAPPALQGPVLEEVLVARDEMANLAWVIELTTRDRDGTRVDRQQRWLRLRPPSDPTFNPGTPRGSSYRLGTTVPDYWYPLVAVKDGGRPLLALAELPEAAGISDDGVRGQLIDHAGQTQIADEEVPREGARLTRRDRLALSWTGPVAWRARTKAPGQGESASGLRFDVLQ